MLATITFATFHHGCSLCSFMQPFIKALALVALIVVCIVAANLVISVLIPLFVLYVLPVLLAFAKVGLILGGVSWLLKAVL